MQQIFISYKREERATAEALASALVMRGFSVWWDRNLIGGEHFDDAIESAIADANSVIVLWSAQSSKSRYVKDEANYALTLGKLIPISLDNSRPPFRFQGLHTISLQAWDATKEHPGFLELIENLEARLDARKSTTLGAVADDSDIGIDANPNDHVWRVEQARCEAQAGESQLGSVDDVGVEDLRRRRFVVLLSGAILTLFAGGIAVSRQDVLQRYLFPSPRFVRRATSGNFQTPLPTGFYRNPRSNVVHHVNAVGLIRDASTIHVSRLASYSADSFNGGPLLPGMPRLRLAISSAAFELTVGELLKAGTPVNDRIFALVMAAINHDVSRVRSSQGKPSLRLYDLVAGLAVRYKRNDILANLLALLSDNVASGVAEARRIKWLDNNSRWHRGWSDRRNDKKWAGLPM